MKKDILFIGLFNFLLTLAYSQLENYVPNELLIQLNYQKNIDLVLTKLNVECESCDFKISKVLSERLNIWLIEFNQYHVSVQDAVKSANRISEVAISQPNHVGIEQRNSPNDPLFINQWDMINDGINGITADADIDAEEAWDISTGGLTTRGDTLVIAVIDGGFDLNHEDLSFWKNRFEIPNNGIDDDNNGYIDDVRGWNPFTNNDDVVYLGEWDDHGTHVSGTVGAIGNNGIGVSGVNWNVKIMPINGSSSKESVVVEAYAFALEHRAKYNETGGTEGAYIVAANSSFGVNNTNPNDYPIWCSFYDSLGAVGILSVGATANLNINVDVYGDVPTGCTSDYLISVTNTNSQDKKEKIAGYGLTTIDIGAPGEQVWSTVPDNNYAGKGWGGTSMATPHVAGAIGLMYSVACKNLLNNYNNNLSELALIFRNYILNQGFDIISDLSGVTVTSGRLNLNKCLLAVKSYDCDQPLAINYQSGKQENKLTNFFPIPVKEWAEIEYVVERNDDININIINVLGEKVLSISKTDVFVGIHRQKIDISGISDGLYFASFTNSSGTSNTIKFQKR